MRETTGLLVPKWPFFVGDAFMLGLAGFVYWQGKSPLSRWDVVVICVCVAVAALLGVLPFLLEYRALIRLIQTSALGSVADRFSNLERVAAQIDNATNLWQNAHGQAEKTADTARQISERMAAEVRDFTTFMQKMNESEKGALRLEAEKLRRAEAEWLQLLVRIFDQTFALHAAAERSGQTSMVEQLGQFQNTCRDLARRVGLAPFIGGSNEPFDPKKHQWADGDSAVPAAAIVAETVAPGYTFQGRLLRPALVRVQGASTAAATGTKPDKSKVRTPKQAEQSQLPLEPVNPA